MSIYGSLNSCVYISLYLDFLKDQSIKIYLNISVAPKLRKIINKSKIGAIFTKVLITHAYHDTLGVALIVHSSEQIMSYISHCVFGCVFFIVIYFNDWSRRFQIKALNCTPIDATTLHSA